MSCYMCLPTCDNCRPKMVTCPSCGAMTFIDLATCPSCKQPLTDEAKGTSLGSLAHQTRAGGVKKKMHRSSLVVGSGSLSRRTPVER